MRRPKPYLPVVLPVMFVCLAGICAPHAGAVVIARDGQGLVPVVVENNPAEMVELGAQEVAHYLARLTGGDFAVIPAAQHDGTPAVFVGAGYLDAPIEARNDWEVTQSLRIFTRDGSLYLTGGGVQGTLSAVYGFLEDDCGIRWLSPGEEGEYIPNTPDLGFTDLDRIETPSFIYRSMWSTDSDRRMRAEHGVWQRRNRQGGVAAHMGHNLFRITPPELFPTHPEYFPLIGEQRLDPRGGQGWQSEFVNPEVTALAVQAAVNSFDANDNLYAFSLSMNDSHGWSEAPEALAEDPEQWRNTPHRGKGRRSIVFANRVAELIERERPGRAVCFYAYMATLEPPDEPRCRDNVIPVIAHWGIGGDQFNPIMAPEQVSPPNAIFRAAIEGWSKLANNIFIREYWTSPYADPLLSAGVTPCIIEDIPYYHRHNVQGCNSEATLEWGAVGLNHYMASKLMWNVNADPEAILADYFDKSYGPAAQTLRTYFEQVWDLAVKRYSVTPREPTSEDWAALGELAAQARELAADTPYAARVTLVADFNEAHTLRREALAARNEPEKVNRYLAFLDELAARESNAMSALRFRNEILSPIPQAAAYDGPDLRPLNPDFAPQEKPQQVNARRRSANWLVWAKADTPIDMVIEGVPVGSAYTNMPAWELVNAAGQVVASGTAPWRGSIEVQSRVPEDGLYQLNVGAGRNAVAVLIKNCPAVMIGPQFAFAEKGGRLYFYVPEELAHFQVTLFADAGESAVMTIYDPDGNEVFSENSLAATIVPARIDVQPQYRGRAWGVELGEAPEGIFEDHAIRLGDELPPYLAAFPEALLLVQ